mgnify:CR=1 FL=1
MKMDLVVSDEFYRRPLGRYKTQGTYTGEAFREGILLSKLSTLPPDEKLLIDFTGVTMNGSSFLEEAFGGLVRAHGYSYEILKNKIILKFPRRPSLEEKVWQYIIDAENELKKGNVQ